MEGNLAEQSKGNTLLQEKKLKREDRKKLDAIHLVCTFYRI
jgi:hypothetical protein